VSGFLPGRASPRAELFENLHQNRLVTLGRAAIAVHVLVRIPATKLAQLGFTLTFWAWVRRETHGKALYCGQETLARVLGFI
jgi:hypothetical protein